MSNVTDLLGFAIDKNPTEFASTVDDILRSKATAALETMKTELAQSVYGSEEDSDDDFDLDDFGDEEDSDDDFDDEDFDIDLDDLDLDDLDLDDLDGDDLDD